MKIVFANANGFDEVLAAVEICVKTNLFILVITFKSFLRVKDRDDRSFSLKNINFFFIYTLMLFRLHKIEIDYTEFLQYIIWCYNL